MASPNLLPTTPPKGSPHRSIYERAYHKSNNLLCASVSIDHRIDMLQQAIDRDLPVDPQIETMYMEETALDALSQADIQGSGDWTDYFRLMSQYRFLEQRIAVPLVFSGGVEKYDAMRHFVDGTYGISGDILFQAMQEFYLSDSAAKRRELTGVISEQTVLALLNRSENYRHFALPSSARDDLHQRTDIDYWRYSRTDSGEHIELIPIQVKTRPPKIFPSTMAPKKPHGIIADAYDTENTSSFRTSHLIIRELGYSLNENEVPDISEAEQDELAGIHTRFMNSIESKYAATRHPAHDASELDNQHHRAKNPLAGILPLLRRQGSES